MCNATWLPVNGEKNSHDANIWWIRIILCECWVVNGMREMSRRPTDIHHVCCAAVIWRLFAFIRHFAHNSMKNKSVIYLTYCKLHTTYEVRSYARLFHSSISFSRFNTSFFFFSGLFFIESGNRFRRWINFDGRILMVSTGGDRCATKTIWWVFWELKSFIEFVF